MVTKGMAAPRFSTPSTAQSVSINESNRATQLSERRQKINTPTRIKNILGSRLLA